MVDAMAITVCGPPAGGSRHGQRQGPRRLRVPSLRCTRHTLSTGHAAVSATREPQQNSRADQEHHLVVVGHNQGVS